MARHNNIFALEILLIDDFSMSRSQMLKLLADAMLVPEERRSAFLGRFQHLQRLSLISGINPGRGRAARYDPLQIMVVAIAFQMLQLGLSPERTVQAISQNKERLYYAISLSTGPSGEEVGNSIIWFDPANITATLDGDDFADVTFHYGGYATGRDAFANFFLEGWVARMAFVNIGGTIWHMIAAMQGGDHYDTKPVIGDEARRFLSGLRSCIESADPSEPF